MRGSSAEEVSQRLLSAPGLAGLSVRGLCLFWEQRFARRAACRCGFQACMPLLPVPVGFVQPPPNGVPSVRALWAVTAAGAGLQPASTLLSQTSQRCYSVRQVYSWARTASCTVLNPCFCSHTKLQGPTVSQAYTLGPDGHLQHALT